AGSMDRKYFFSQPEKIAFGFGTVKRVGKEAGSITDGRKAQVITDKGVAYAGLLDQVVDPLQEYGFQVEVWDQASGEPDQKTIEGGYREVREHGPDLVVGLGGGSSIDLAKFISGMLTNPGPFEENFSEKTGVGQFKKPPTPLLAVPTTSGTGAENTWLAICSLTGVEGKVGFADPKLIPRKAVVDPGLTVGLPPGLTARTGVDALTHLFEGYLTINCNPFLEALAIQGARTVPEYLPRAVEDGNDQEARFHMMLQANMGGLSLNYGGVNDGHLIGHMIGDRYHIPHGVAQGITLPYCLNYNLQTFPREIANLARWWGLDVEGMSEQAAGERLVRACAQLLEDLGMPWRLADVEGASKEDIPEMAEALSSTPYFVTTAKSCCMRISKKEDYELLMERMFDGDLPE
ncbi:MAG: iron-containing alcohol dehydrogenase, partial [Methanomassiliicoccales archaeon]